MGSSKRRTGAGRHSTGVWVLAARQHGVISRRQLLEAGLSAQSIQHRLQKGRLHRLRRGIYAVGRPGLTQSGRWMAAVLGCGPTAVLSHGSAAALWGIAPSALGPIEVTIRVAHSRRRADVRVHRRPKLRAADVTVHDGIPVTTPVHTLIDVARRWDDARLERAVNEADRLDLIDAEALGEALDDYPGVPGVGRLRALLDCRTFRLTESELERRFLRLVADVGLPVPQTQQRVNGFRVDFFWPRLGLVVETDGLRYHRTPTQQMRDRTRDQAHAAAGMTPLRFTHAQVRFEPAEVRRTLVAVARRLQRAGGGHRTRRAGGVFPAWNAGDEPGRDAA